MGHAVAASSHNLELLAPAGDWAALEAALDAGADAVYFGLATLNARRRAANFDQEQFGRAVELCHARGKRAYLTLNTDLSQRELGQAARILELARQCGIDGVLVRDPSLLALKSHYPQVTFHLSTQTCMASSADVAAARELGASRVVLAREMSLGEIAAASSLGVQTEVFVQGALCYCISGRCLLSSWIGGRSGNRGACTSPCRAPWTIGGQAAGTPLSMRDLSAAHRFDDLRRAGLTALKIEGRLKSAAWVAQAVTLYRRALAGEDTQSLEREAAELGAYTGRQMTCAFLDGQREGLIGLAVGRAPLATQDASPPGQPVVAPPHFDLAVSVQPKAIVVECRVGQRSVEWSLPKTLVRRVEKAVTIASLLESLGSAPILGCAPGKLTTNEPAFLLVPRAANAIADRLASSVRQFMKTADDQVVRIEISGQVKALLAGADAAHENHLTLGDPPDRVRLPAGAVADFLRRVRAAGHGTPGDIIVEGVSAQTLDQTLAACAGLTCIVALPQVFFEADIPSIQQLLSACAGRRVSVEVNNWGGWHLARGAGVRFETGPGLGVLNALAAEVLHERQAACVTLSIEADRRQLEDASARCPAPCSLVVF
jgi:collagenase-like PrtC family protease